MHAFSPCPPPESRLIAVTADDQALAPLSKAHCHAGDGVLHRAFSVFLFDPQGRVLLQRRSALKPLWPGYWANSCCSHPRWGESLADAVLRRVREELGVELTAPPRWRFRFVYHARYGAVGSEHELCHVFTAPIGAATPHVDPDEVGEWRWIAPAALQQALDAAAMPFAPWLPLEWRQLSPLLRADPVAG